MNDNLSKSMVKSAMATLVGEDRLDVLACEQALSRETELIHTAEAVMTGYLAWKLKGLLHWYGGLEESGSNMMPSGDGKVDLERSQGTSSGLGKDIEDLISRMKDI